MSRGTAPGLTRRACLVQIQAAAGLVPLVPLLHMGTAGATPEALEQAVAAYTRGAALRDGRVSMELAELVENGNAVPLTLRVDSPMTPAEHVRSLAVFTEKNPQPEVAVFHFTSASGRAQVSTRIRLSTSQRVVAVATLSDGSCWRAQADVVVTLAACIEG